VLGIRDRIRSAIMRFDLVESLTRNASSDYVVQIKGGPSLKVSRSRSYVRERRMALRERWTQATARGGAAARRVVGGLIYRRGIEDGTLAVALANFPHLSSNHVQNSSRIKHGGSFLHVRPRVARRGSSGERLFRTGLPHRGASSEIRCPAERQRK
jgi:hypothetical protein